MKQKTNHTGLVLTIAVGTLAAAAVAYLYLTEDGQGRVNGMKYKLKEGLKDIASGAISAATNISRDTVKKVADLIVK